MGLFFRNFLTKKRFPLDGINLMKYPMSGMVQVMCTNYYSFQVTWEICNGEQPYKPVYGARFAVATRFSEYGDHWTNEKLKENLSFREILLMVAGIELGVTPGACEPVDPRLLAPWLRSQKEVTIPEATWTTISAPVSKHKSPPATVH